MIEQTEAHLLWIEHSKRAEARIAVDNSASLVEAHALSHRVEHDLVRGVRRQTAPVTHAKARKPDPAAEHAQIPPTEEHE